MTQSQPTIRRSTRIQPDKTKVVLTKKTIKKPQFTISKKMIDKVIDFQKRGDILMYNVHFEGYGCNSWVTESAVENVTMINDYKEKIKAKSGYSIDPTSDPVSSRPSRFTKTRALMNIKTPAFEKDSDDDSDEDDEDEEQNFRGTKRKSSGSTEKSKKKLSAGGKGRKTKAQLLLETRAQERLERKKFRMNLDGDAIAHELDHTYGKDCCLLCSANDYRKKLEEGDFEGFKALFNDVKHTTVFNEEKKPNGLDLIAYAIILEKFDFAEYATSFDNYEKKRLKPIVPNKYKSYGENTGYNRGYGINGRQSFRQVQESRGNRLGNSAFYEDNKRTFINVEDNIRNANIRPYLHYINRNEFNNPDVISAFINWKQNENMSVYYIVNSGNRYLAQKIIEQSKSADGRSPFNHLHEEVLKFDGKQALSTYRRPQILKFANDACNLTPYHCAAIHPSSTYLKELYEALEVAERFETDSIGRSVAFYAAVSETTECLEFLIANGFNFVTHDKYKLTPLIQAARFGRSHNVEVLIKHLNGGSDASTISESTFQTLTRNRRTALHYAAYFGHAETCKVLIDYHAPVNVLENLDKQSPLHFAAKNGNLECVRTLIEEGKANPELGDKFGRNALHLACIGGHINIVQYLLSQGVDSNAGDSSNNHPVHYAAAFGHLQILHLLINYGGADPTVPNVWRNTACSIANTKGHLAIVRYLLQLPKSPIDVNFKDQEGYIMLQHVINESVSGNSEMDLNLEKAELLLSMKADPNSIDLEGYTSLHTLASNDTFAKLLPKDFRSFYPTVNRSYNNRRNIPHPVDDMDGIEYQIKLAEKLIAYGADLTIKSQNKETALSIAMNSNNHHLVAVFIENGARFWVDTNSDGSNFFHYFGKLAAYISKFQPHTEQDTLIQKRFLDAANKVWKSVEMKISPNIDLTSIINAYDNNGYSPILIAIKEAIHNQKQSIIREKKLIHSYIRYNTPSTYHYNRFGSESFDVSEKFRETEGMIDVDLRFDFSLFIEMMEKVIKMSKLDLNSIVALPKDFKKDKSKLNKPVYPPLTGYTALHFACQTQCTDLIKFLLFYGADANVKINIEGTLDSTPMIIAYHEKKDKYQDLPDRKLETVELGKKKFNVTRPDFPLMLNETIQLLLNYNACPYITNRSGVSALSMASTNMDVDCIKLMCTVKPSAGADINTKDENHKTALMVAVDAIPSLKEEREQSYLQIFQSLLKSGADPNAQYEDGDTVLMKAIRNEYADLVKVIIEYKTIPIDHNHQNKNLETALLLVCKLNNAKILSYYSEDLKKNAEESMFDCNRYDSTWHTPLSYASKKGSIEAVKMLLSLGADPNFCNYDSVPLIKAVESDNIELIEMLIQHGAKVNQKGSSGNTALHTAVLHNRGKTVNLLLSHSADANARNKINQTPLHLAITITKELTNRSFRIERSLINSGSDINAVDVFGRTPLHYVFVGFDSIPITKNTTIITKKLQQIAKEVEAEKQNEANLSKYISDFKLYEGPNLDDNLLHSWLKEAKKIQLEINAKNAITKNKPYDFVISDEEKNKLKTYKNFTWEDKAIIPERFDPIDIIKYILLFDTLQLDVQDEFGRTPLHYAACVGAFSCTNLLIEKGCNLNILDTDNNSALQLALRNNYVDYSIMLFNHGAEINKDILLKNGESVSTFGFSLSKSLINIAYLIMDKGILLVESISDALKNGKFHMVEILLQSAKDEELSKTLPEDGKNIWHILADFKPFEMKLWDEYLPDFITKISSLNVSICKDNFGRTPLHYAAKNGQYSLLKHLVSIKGVTLNNYDVDGVSEISYAVQSNQTNCVQILLDAGANVLNQTDCKSKSSLLIAVEGANYEMVKLLLKNGAKTDDQDTVKGYANSVMTACVDKNLDMLKLLIEYGADVDKPSNIKREDKDGVMINVLIHPLFIASKVTSEYLKIMLDAGANPNVYGPNIKPENGISFFMYNVSMNYVKNVELLLDYHSVDLNVIDSTNSRSIFYEFFFWRMLQDQGSKYTSVVSKMNVSEVIYDKMLKAYIPDVNKVDEVTGMTPLELAINQKNKVIIERLLSFGANVNLESCGHYENSSILYVLNPKRIKIPAILYALIQNDMEILELICSVCYKEINWSWTDSENNTLLSYVTGLETGYHPANLNTLLTFMYDRMGSKTFKNLIKMKNVHGVSTALLAYHKQKDGLYIYLQSFDFSLPSYIQNNYDVNAFDSDIEISPMEVDGISLKEVDEYAQIERENLQREKELDDIKKGKTRDEKEDESFKVDEYAKLEKVATVVADEETGLPYNVTLMKVELRSWGNDTDTSIYKLSIFYNKVVNIYILWTRWGPLGNEGQHQKTPYLTKEEAVAEFNSIFKSKTGSVWDFCQTTFEPKPGRYELMIKSHHPKDMIIKNFNFLKSNVESQLPFEVLNTMKLVCNFNYLSKVYKETNIAMPLGQLPQKTIEEAQTLLKETQELIRKYTEAKRFYSDKMKVMEAKLYSFKIAQNCVKYSRLLPRHGADNQPIRSLYNYNETAIASELSRIADLGYVGFAANVILAAKHHVNTINPLDYAYRTLDCSLKQIPTTSDCPDYQLIKRYMDASASETQEIVHLFAVNRADEASRYRPFENDPDRKLLWHGSRIANFMGIMKQGLRVAPRTTSNNGALLGSGIYFADTFAKSLNYSSDSYGSQESAYKILLLCEVALGTNKGHYINSALANEFETYDSVKGQGINVPNPEYDVYDSNGVCIPIGPSIPYIRDPSNTNYATPHLNYNEYTVYNQDRIKIRYLVVIREPSRCYLCNTKKSLLPLEKHELKGYKYSDFNTFEAELIKAYLTHENKTYLDIYKEDLDMILETKIYKKTWDIPLDMHKDDKICDQCASKLTTIMLEKRMTAGNGSSKIYDLLKYTPICKYGKKCRTQSSVIHSKSYKHWFYDETVEKPKENLEETSESTEADDEEMDTDNSDSETDDENSSMDED